LRKKAPIISSITVVLELLENKSEIATGKALTELLDEFRDAPHPIGAWFASTRKIVDTVRSRSVAGQGQSNSFWEGLSQELAVAEEERNLLEPVCGSRCWHAFRKQGDNLLQHLKRKITERVHGAIVARHG